ncbi:DUF4179 domain-containing protein [Neobacillus dielmonensis]|uniref:DUF4179 domain-containing protein n=1 Tax=Neobacillus dielmonensis TaxID=1347369 RepID=UPI0005A66851|nr:DUF4179 domain-containing protein [Neobacillus dielmonensis]
MIPAKIDSISATMKEEKSMDPIIDWFDRHKQSFYTLGLSYLKSQQQIEELFYRSIKKVKKELRKFKRETSFETWVTSIFIETCRELTHDSDLPASEEGEPRHDFFRTLDKLKESEREALVLTYVNGTSKENAAHLLQISVEKIKELLFSGIRSFRQEIGYGLSFNGCTEYHKIYMDYLEGSLERSKKIDFEIHIYHCQDCQEDLAAFQEVMLSLADRMEDLPVPFGLLENVKNRMAEQANHKQKSMRKRKKIGAVFAGVVVLLLGIGLFTGAFTHAYYSWTEDNPQLRAFLQQGFGERLDLEAESNGVKIKIKGAIADDVQTLVFYEIEDTEEDNQYLINYDDGIFVGNRFDIMERDTNPKYYPPDLKLDVNNKNKNVYQGKISLQPLSKDNATIKMKITKLQKLIRDPSDSIDGSAFESMFEKGEWNFEIPVTKQPSKEYALDKETELEGVPIRFDKLILAPTATLLQYSINNDQRKKRIDYVNFDNLQVNDKKVKSDLYGGSFIDASQDTNWSTFQINFDPLFGEKPKDVRVQFGSVSLSVEEQKDIALDADEEYPQTFEYAGSTISIDKLEVGQPTKMVISNANIENRTYESLQFNILGEDKDFPISMDMNFEGVLVDKNGVKYDENQMPFSYEEVEQPRYFFTVQSLELRSEINGENVIPKTLQIYGYNTTKYLDDVVKISLE